MCFSISSGTSGFFRSFARYSVGSHKLQYRGLVCFDNRMLSCVVRYCAAVYCYVQERHYILLPGCCGGSLCWCIDWPIHANSAFWCVVAIYISFTFQLTLKSLVGNILVTRSSLLCYDVTGKVHNGSAIIFSSLMVSGKDYVSRPSRFRRTLPNLTRWGDQISVLQLSCVSCIGIRQ